MKKLILVCGLWLALGGWARAQWVSIPDTNFGTWLDTSGYNQCLQGNNLVGWQMDTTCNAINIIGVIDCSNKRIENVQGIQYFKSLKSFTCAGNYALKQITELPSGLTHLEVPMGSLSALPTLPSSLQVLVCYKNQLQSLPVLPLTLQYLNCDSNHITALPALPNSLKRLICSANQLTAIDSLPPNLDWLMCYSNQLTYIGKLPDTLTYFWTHNTPLACLPALTRIREIDFTNTNVLCIPNQGSVFSSNPSLTSLPYCINNNPNNCSILSSITNLSSLCFSLTPNPASSYLTISINEEHTGSTLTLTDLTGRVVFKSEIENSKSEINIASLPSGIYLAVLTTPNGQRAVKKLVKE